MKRLNSTGGEECGRLVFSSLGPVLEESAQSSESEVLLTQDGCYCAPSLDLGSVPRYLSLSLFIS